MKTRDMTLIATTVLAGMLGACATTAPPQLVEAREAFAASSKGPASQVDANRSLRREEGPGQGR